MNFKDGAESTRQTERTVTSGSGTPSSTTNPTITVSQAPGASPANQLLASQLLGLGGLTSNPEFLNLVTHNLAQQGLEVKLPSMGQSAPGAQANPATTVSQTPTVAIQVDPKQPLSWENEEDLKEKEKVEEKNELNKKDDR